MKQEREKRYPEEIEENGLKPKGDRASGHDKIFERNLTSEDSISSVEHDTLIGWEQTLLTANPAHNEGEHSHDEYGSYIVDLVRSHFGMARGSHF